MKKKIFGIFLFHLICLGLLLVPDAYQGPVISVVSGLELRTLDITALFMIVLGSISLNVLIFSHYWPQIKQIKETVSGDVTKKNN